MKYLLLFLSFYSFSFSQFGAAPAYQPYNLDFENAVVGAMPAKWVLSNESSDKGYYAEASDENPYSGKYCLKMELVSDSIDGTKVSGITVQSFNASPYLGKKIRLTSHIRAEIDGEGYAGFYVSERTFQNEYPFVNVNEDNPIVFNTWEEYTIEYTPTEDAFSINIGLYLKGKGKAWIDAISVEIIDEIQNIEKPSPISKSKAMDFLNFAKSYGYTRFFHPSDEVENISLETYLYHSINAINKTDDKQIVDKIIQDRITRIAPSAKFFKNQNAASKYKVDKPINSLDRVAVTKVTNNLYYKQGDFTSGSKRWNIYDSRMPREAATYQILGAKSIQGKKIKYKVDAKVRPYGNDAHAELWFRIDFDDPAKNPINIRMPDIITSDKWKGYTMEVDIPADAKQIRTGLVLFGEGQAWFDDIKLSSFSKRVDVEYNPKNNSFNKKWQPNNIEYWRIPESILKSGYSFTIDNTKESKDGSSLLISTDREKYIPLPKPGEICNLQIDENMWLALPLTVYDDGTITIPKSTAPKEAHVSMNPSDKITKIAAFTEMWNFLKFFSTLDYTDEQWDNLFLENISNLAETKTPDQFVTMLNSILKITNNIRSEAWLSDQSKDFSLPFIVDFEGDDIKVIKSFDKQIEVGDKVLNIGNLRVSEYIQKEIQEYPGESEIWKQKKAFYKLAANDFKSTEKITVLRNGEEKEFDITRNLTNREVQIFRPLTIEWLDTNTLYVDGTRLNDFEMSELMGNFTKAKGIIIDLRGDALLSEHFLGFFIDENIPTFNWQINIFTNPCQEPQSREIVGYVKAKPSELTRNIVFVTNETSVGKSETILQLIKYYGIGKIIGETTAGSYDMMSEVKLPALYNFSFDIYPMKFGDDSHIKYKPIVPDITVTGKGDYLDDPKIKKAIELLKKNY